MVKKRGKWGGVRAGAGRKPTGNGPRANRVTVFLSDAEYQKLRAIARRRGDVPIGAAAYELLSDALRVGRAR